MTPQIDPYSSHLPTLAAAMGLMARHGGDVLELGSGLYSTPVLKAFSHAIGITFRSFDNDRDWALRSGATDIIDSWDDLHRHGEELRCFIAFIDVAPASMRGPLIDVMRRWADIIIVHDTETEQRHNYPGVEERLSTFRYRLDDKRRGPWTTVVSDTVTLDAFAW